MALPERPGHFQNILDLPTAAAGNHIPSNKHYPNTRDFEPLSCLPCTECLCLELPTPFLIHMQVSSSLSSYQFLWVNSSFQIPFFSCLKVPQVFQSATKLRNQGDGPCAELTESQYPAPLTSFGPPRGERCEGKEELTHCAVGTDMSLRLEYPHS